MLLRRLAVGGMAEVYVAKTKGIGGFEKLVAIKVIHPRFSEDEHFVQMLVEEAKISVQLNHVNIAQTFDLGCIDDTYYIAMEYIEGADAFRVGKRARDRKVSLPIDICCYIAAEVCSGLSYAHRKHGTDGKPLGIVHRDISPQNVLITYSGEVKLVDFGIAKAALRGGQTEVGVIKGKYYYMSPEQAWGDPVDQRTDIFATGLLLHELLTGEMVYQEDNVPALLDRVRKADVPSPRIKRRDVPEALEAMLKNALAKEAEDRYPSAHAFAQDLTKLLYQTNPTFTAQRLAQLMGLLFPEEVRRHSSEIKEESSEDQDLSSMSRDEFTPSAEDSKIFDVNALRKALTRETRPAPPKPAPPAARPAPPDRAPTPSARANAGAIDRPTKELRSPVRRPPSPPAEEEDTTSQHAAQDEWEEETVLKDDDESWDESTLIDQDGSAMKEVRRHMKARAQRPRPPDVNDDDVTHDVSGEIAGEKTVAMASFPDATVRMPSKKLPSKPPPPARALPPRPPPPPSEPDTPIAGAPTQVADSALSALGADAEPTDLPAEKTIALAQGAPLPQPARRAASIAQPSSAGVRLGPDADRFFQASNPAIAIPVSPLEPMPSGSFAAPPPDHDPFVAQPPPPGVAASAEALGKPQPKRFILPAIVAVGVIAVTVSVITWVAASSDPETVVIRTVPDGASVQLDGLVMPEATPATIPDLEVGRTYRLQLMRRGFETHQEDITINEGQRPIVRILDPIRVTLHVETEPAGAQVWVDNTLRGSAPLDIPGLTAGQIVMLRSFAPGYDTAQQQVTLDDSDRNPRVMLRLSPTSP